MSDMSINKIVRSEITETNHFNSEFILLVCLTFFYYYFMPNLSSYLSVLDMTVVEIFSSHSDSYKHMFQDEKSIRFTYNAQP